MIKQLAKAVISVDKIESPAKMQNMVLCEIKDPLFKILFIGFE